MSDPQAAWDLLESIRAVAADYGAEESDMVRWHLAQELALLRQNRRNPLAYEGPQGFVLRHGLDWQSQADLPDGFDWMEQKMCFSNAAELALSRDDVTYVEGYAMGRFFPIPHAWVVDREGRVIDPTWHPSADEERYAPREEWRYVGVPFTTAFLREQLLRNEMYGVIDQWETGYRLLQRRLPRRAVPRRYQREVFGD